MSHSPLLAIAANILFLGLLLFAFIKTLGWLGSFPLLRKILMWVLMIAPFFYAYEYLHDRDEDDEE